MSEDDGTTKSGSMRKLQEIDEQITRYNRTVSKERWIGIDNHWKTYKIQRKELIDKLQTMLTPEEMKIIGIY